MGGEEVPKGGVAGGVNGIQHHECSDDQGGGKRRSLIPVGVIEGDDERDQIESSRCDPKQRDPGDVVNQRGGRGDEKAGTQCAPAKPSESGATRD